MRNTRQRQVIVEVLGKLESRPSAEELRELVRRRLPRISLGTIYRNLETLSMEGVVRRLKPGGTQARFDGDMSEHQHLRCRSGGRVDDLRASADPAERDTAALESTGYRPIERHVEFVGICPECARRMGGGN